MTFKRLLTAAGLWLAMAPALAVAQENSSQGADIAPSSFLSTRQLRDWSAMYLGGHRKEVIATVEANLRSAKPDPQAGFVWCMLQGDRLSDEKAAYERVTDPSLKKALGPLMRMRIAYFSDERLSDFDQELAAGSPSLPINAWFLAARRQNYTNDGPKVGDALATALAMVPADQAPPFILASRLVDNVTLPGTLSTFKARAKGLPWYPAVERYVAHQDGSNGIYPIDIPTAVRQWPAWSSDPDALGKLGDNAKNLHRFDDAAHFYAQSVEVFPFNSWMHVALASAYLRAGHREQALAVVRRLAVAQADSAADQQRETKMRWVEALIDAGELGEARDELAALPPESRTSARYLNLAASMERQSGRYAQVVSLTRQISEPLDFDDQLGAIGDMSNDPASVAKAWDQLQAIDPALSQSAPYFASLGATLLRQLKRDDAVLEWTQRWSATFPHRTDLRIERAHALERKGRCAESVAVIEDLMTFAQPTEDALSILRRCKLAESEAAAAATFAQLRQRMPNVFAVWHVSDKLLIDGKRPVAERQELWEQAARMNPDWTWPLANIISLRPKDWTGNAKLAHEASLRNAADKPTVAARFDELELDQIVDQASEQTIEPEILARGTAIVEAQGRMEGIDADWLLRGRSALRAAVGDSKGAGEDLLQAFTLAPDDWNIGFDALTKYGRDVGLERAMRQAYHYLERNPYDGARLNSIAHITAMWYPNPVETLRLISLARERAPAWYSKAYEAMALGRLGDFVDDYRGRYTGDDVVCTCGSSRYIDWFEDARSKAQSGKSNKVVSTDFDKGTVRLRLPSGVIVVRGWHRYSDKPSLVQVGEYFVKSTLDDNGNYRRIEDSAGHYVELSYDAQQRIIGVMQSGGENLAVKYDEHGKMVEIVDARHGTTHLAGGQLESASGANRLQALHALMEALDHATSLTHTLEQEGMDLAEVPHFTEMGAGLEIQLQHWQMSRRGVGAGAAPASRAAFEAESLKFAEALAPALKYDERNTELFRRVLSDLHELVRDSRSTGDVLAGARGVAMLHDYFREWMPEGIAREDWEAWVEQRDWLAQHAILDGRAAQIQAKLDKEPLDILPPAQWLASSRFGSPGYWHAHRDPRLRAGKSVLVRANGEILVGTSTGLMVFREGYWTRFVYDVVAHRFSRSDAVGDDSPNSDILALAEIKKTGTLWIGTARGLVRLEGDYEGPARRWTEQDGLPDAYVRLLAVAGDDIYVATENGLAWSGDSAVFHAVNQSDLGRITSLKPAMVIDEDDAAPAWAVLSTNAGVWRLAQGKAAQIDAFGADDALALAETVYMLRSDGLWTRSIADAASVPSMRLRGQEGLVKAQKITGLAAVPLGTLGVGVGVMTDAGISIYRDGHTEHMTIPLAKKIAGVDAMASSGQETAVITSDGLRVVELEQAVQDERGRVYAILAMDDLGLTFVARGDTLEVVEHARPERGARPFDNISAKVLARDASGRLLANDGMRIVRYERGEATATRLFSAEHRSVARPDGNSTGDDRSDYAAGEVRSLLVASDGTVWVAAGASVFRWKEGMDAAAEYSVFTDPQQFPAPTSMVSRIVETLDHRILVICSDEEHLVQRGVRLSGGVMEWKGTHFVLDSLKDRSKAWFITGYTPIDAEHAIVSTSGDFVEETSSGYKTFVEARSTSYAALKRQTQTVVGTDGAKLGDGTWLFGSVGGVLGYRNGTWFYPDRINWMLPEDYRFKSQYGVRMVHAIATDKAGRIYVGNDRGLLIYESNGGDSMSFLVENGESGSLMVGASEILQRQQSKTLIGGLDRSQPAVDLALRVLEARDDIEKPIVFEERGAPATSQSDVDKGDGRGTVRAAAAPPGLSELQARKQRYLELLLKLKHDSPSLDALVNVEPLDLSRLHGKLRPDQIILQYLPAENDLFIHVLLHDDTTAIRVPGVRQADLLALIAHANAGLAKSAAAGGGKDEPALVADLVALDRTLLGPVAGYLENKSAIFIVAGKGFSQLPMGALMHRNGQAWEYAVQRYTFGYLSNLAMLDRIDQAPAATSAVNSLVVFADPDASLGAATSEAKAIVDIVKGSAPPRLGPDASIENLHQLAPTAGILHLATHGVLDPVQPQRSYLQFAQSKRLTVSDAMMLSLSNSKLVVLSACESGIGGDGLEYSSLAEAFNMAGAPTLVATLWKIPDEASAPLMQQFYKNVVGGQDKFTALANAQRSMLLRDGASASVRNWAGFVPFGKP